MNDLMILNDILNENNNSVANGSFTDTSVVFEILDNFINEMKDNNIIKYYNVKSNSNMYIELFDIYKEVMGINPDNNSYGIRNSNFWGGNQELSLMSKYFKVNIIIIQSNNQIIPILYRNDNDLTEKAKFTIFVYYEPDTHYHYIHIDNPNDIRYFEDLLKINIKTNPQKLPYADVINYNRDIFKEGEQIDNSNIIIGGASNGDVDNLVLIIT
jgi:hypothetical protein